MSDPVNPASLAHFAALPAIALGDPVRLLRWHRDAPFEFGVSDCSICAADYVFVTQGFDPMADWRGAYLTDAQAMAMVQAGGGMVASWRAAMDEIDIADARDGDVLASRTEAGPMHAGQVWVKRPGTREMITDPARFEAAFRVPA